MAKTLDQNLTMVMELKDMFSSPAKTISQAATRMAEDNKKLQTASEGGASTAEKNAKALQDLATAAQNAATAEAAAPRIIQGSSRSDICTRLQRSGNA